MRLAWTAEQRQRYERVLADVRDRLARDDPGPAARVPFDNRAWKTCGQLGLLGLTVDREHGGGGHGALETAHLLEAFGRACPDMGLVFAAGAHLLACVVPISRFGSDALRRTVLAALAAGDLVGANAMTEPGAGSDIGAIATTAEASGEGYVLNGEKSFVSNAPLADVIVTYAKTDPTAGHMGITAFAVERGTEGVEVGEPLRKTGLHGCPAARVTFRDCWVPADHVLGEPGQGAAVFRWSMTWERACLPAAWIGAGDRSLERCISFARERRQFGRPLSAFQAVAHRLVDMRARLEAARWLVYRACWLVDQGDQEADEAVALAKLTASRAVVRCGLDAVELFGARGYVTDEGVDEVLRDALAASTASGTADIQREIAARTSGL